jgi:hypothetical protein
MLYAPGRMSALSRAWPPDSRKIGDRLTLA